MSRPATSLLALIIVATALVGCGGPEDAVAPLTPPEDYASPMQVGPLMVRPASAAGFTTLEIPTMGPVSLVALYGSQINYLASLAMLDRIVYTSGTLSNANIYICDLDGTNRTRVTNNTANETAPAWSPDGTTIAFTRQRPPQDAEVCLIGADGSNPRALTDNTATDCHPTWSPDGRRIAFQTDRDSNYEIYVMYSDGSGAVNLTNNGAADESPDWSASLSNSLIAFSSNRDGNDEIYTMRPDGSFLTRRTTNPTADREPAFCPISNELAFERVVQGGFDIMSMWVSSGSASALVSASGPDLMPAYSSDGRFVCYASLVGGDYELMLQQTEPPYNRWQLTYNSGGIMDLYPDLGSPTLQTDRVIIGPAGSDWGGANPIWSNAYAAVTAYSRDGYHNLVRIGVRAEDADTVQISPLSSTAQGGQPAAVMVEAAEIVNLREDGGRGQRPVLWQFDPLDATAVALYFDIYYGKLLAAMVIRDRSYPAGVGADRAPLSQRVEGEATVVEGDFSAVFDGNGARIADAASAVRITGDQVTVVR